MVQHRLPVLGGIVIFFCGVLLGFSQAVLTEVKIVSLYERCSAYSLRKRVVCIQNNFFPYIRFPDDVRAFMHVIETTNINHQDSAMPLTLGCHDIGHIVGEIASQRDIPIGTLVSACGNSCEYGCVHGAITAKIRSNPRLVDQVSELCDANRKQSLTKIQQIACHHGIGHVLAEFSGYKVPESLDRCTKLLSVDARSDCASGVFMEVFRPPTLSHISKPLPDDMVDYCNKIPDEYRLKCIYDGAMVMYTFHKSLQKGMDVCRVLSGFEQTECAKAVGGAVYAEVQADPVRVVALCHTVIDQELPCLLGAIVQPLVIDSSGKLSLEICQKTEGKLREYCEVEVQLMRKNFNTK